VLALLDRKSCWKALHLLIEYILAPLDSSALGRATAKRSSRAKLSWAKVEAKFSLLVLTGT